MRPATAILAELEVRDLAEQGERTARAAHVTLGELLGRSRAPEVVRARHAFLGHLVNACGFSAASAGRLLGLDHSTVLSALKRLPRTQEASE